MAFDDSMVTASAPAGADLSTHQYKCVKFNATGQVILSTADADPSFLLQNDPVSGEAAQIALAGVAKGMAGGAITPGARVAPIAANGKLQAAAAADCSLGIYIGAAASVDTEIISVVLTGHEVT